MLSIWLAAFLVFIGVLCLCVRSVLEEMKNSLTFRSPRLASTRSFQGNSEILWLMQLGAWLIPFGFGVMAIGQLSLIEVFGPVAKVFDWVSSILVNVLLAGMAYIVTTAVLLERDENRSVEDGLIDDGN